MKNIRVCYIDFWRDFKYTDFILHQNLTKVYNVTVVEPTDSDIDLMIVSGIEGIEYYQLLNELETKLKKKIDLLRLETAIQNVKLMNEILKDGIKIYG